MERVASLFVYGAGAASATIGGGGTRTIAASGVVVGPMVVVTNGNG